jgi:hypothetical protein
MSVLHPRHQLRHAIRDRLADFELGRPHDGYWTPAEDRVYANRSVEIDPDELPLILVSCKEEEVELINRSDFDGGYRRMLMVHVEGLCMALDNVDDALDAMALGIEAALDGLLVEGLETAMLQMVRTDLDVDRDGEVPIGAVRITYRAPYLSYRLGVDLGLWDRDNPANCPGPVTNTISLRAHAPEGSVDFDEMVISNGDI